jgi:uncharacterized membrane protein
MLEAWGEGSGMIIGMAIIGAVLGWVLAEFDGLGFWFGGFAGAAAGWVMRRAVRAEVARQLEAFSARWEGPLATAPAPEPAMDIVSPRPAADVTAAPVAEPVEQPQWVAPASPPEPGVLAHLFGAARGWLFGGNTVVRVGLVLLFVGLSFLASYAASAGLFPVELRLALVAAVGAALLVTGFRTRARRPGFGLALQGGGVAAIYLALFGAAQLVEGVPLPAVFVLMVLVCALGCALALVQGSQALAVTAFAGGFATPVLLSDGPGPVAGLFAYLTILNLAILFIATRRAWRGLNLLGFFATFAMTSLWLLGGYDAGDFAITQAFLAASVLIYLVAGLLYTGRAPGRFGAAVDGTLLFGPALAGFGLEAALVGDRPFGAAFAAVGFAAVYLAAASWAARRPDGEARLLRDGLLAIGVGFATVAVPLALGARWTSVAWALEGAGAVWLGARQARWLPRLFGLALIVLATFIFLGELGPPIAALPLANHAFSGAVLVALGWLGAAWWLRSPPAVGESGMARRWAALEARLPELLFLTGFGTLWLGFALEANRMRPPRVVDELPAPVFSAGTAALLAMLAYVALAFGFQALGRRTGWRVATWPSRASVVALAFGLLASNAAGRHVLLWPDILLWAAALALHARMLFLNDHDGAASGWWTGAAHVAGVWLGVALLADTVRLGIDRAQLWDSSWSGVAFLASATAVLAGLTAWAGPAMTGGAARWPLDRHAFAYGWVAAVPVAACVALGAAATALAASGVADPLPYVPVLNPVDLTVALAIAVLAWWRARVLAPAPPGAEALRGPGGLAALAGLAFLAVNAAWLRAAHRLLGVPWTPEDLLDSVVVQSGLAILWTLLALPLMALGHRRGLRSLWLTGAALLGLTVAKLLLVDLNSAGGGARIVVFIVVGVLMLVIGYLAPLPPRRAGDDGGEMREATA